MDEKGKMHTTEGCPEGCLLPPCLSSETTLHWLPSQLCVRPTLTLMFGLTGARRVATTAAVKGSGLIVLLRRTHAQLMVHIPIVFASLSMVNSLPTIVTLGTHLSSLTEFVALTDLACACSFGEMQTIWSLFQVLYS